MEIVKRIVVDLTLNDFMAFTRFELANSSTIRRMNNRTLTAFILMFVVPIVAIFWLFEQDRMTIVSGLILVLMCMFIWPRQVKRAEEERTKAFYSQFCRDELVNKLEMQIEDSGLVIITNASMTNWNWHSIKRIETTDDHHFVFVTDTSALIIPRQHVAEGNVDAFAAEMKRRLSD
ncbi:MAG: YcxB family protein [Planctomycetaceae bacterium]